MATVTNVKTYDARKSIRESLADIIFDISPTSTPFMSTVGRDKTDNTYFEWQTDTLASPDLNNAAIEGASAGDADFVATNRVANYTQISTKVVAASGTADAVNAAGMKTILAYETAKKGKEIKRDMESILLSNQAGAAGNGTSAPRKLAGLAAWLRTNAVANGLTPPTMSSTNDGYPNAGWTGAATAVAFTEAMLKDAMQQAWTEGGEPSMLMVGPYNKTVASTFTGLALNRIDNSGNAPVKIVAAADVYLSDFGKVSIVPNRFTPENFAYLIDPNYVKVTYLRPFQTEVLAKTGDATKKQLLVEYSLRCNQEKAHAIICNLETTA